MSRLSLLVVSVALLSPAIPPFPAYMTMPPQASIADPNTIVDELYSEGYFQFGGNDNLKRGRHFQARFKFDGVEFDDNNTWRPKVWNPIRTALGASGWVVKEFADTNPPMATLQYAKPGVEAWIRMQLFSPEQIELDFIEVKAFTPTLTLPAPAAVPEKIGETASFPFLPAIGGKKPSSADPDNGELWVKFKGDEQSTLVAATSVRKNYQEFPGLSNLQFALEYRAAFTKAGWQIVEESQGINQSDAVITAHYARDGRDIWAYVRYGGDLNITVGEAGDLAAALKKDCHVPLYGVTFDFNKTTLRPDSEGILQKVVALLGKDTALAVEVQGHTDNVGGDDYNLKLSQGRADAVKTWLVAHTIPATRITTRGYGRTQPIASNDNDEGRAKNRRVELARAGCK